MSPTMVAVTTENSALVRLWSALRQPCGVHRVSIRHSSHRGTDHRSSGIGSPLSVCIARRCLRNFAHCLHTFFRFRSSCALNIMRMVSDLAFLALSGAAMTAAATPDLILINGKFHTVDRQNPIASAVAISAGKFVEVGDAASVMRHKKTNTKVIDLGGRTVVPGLNDSHLHLIRGGLNYNLELRWEGVPSVVDALRMLKTQALRTPHPQWVRVIGGWTEFQFAEKRMPTLE